MTLVRNLIRTLACALLISGLDKSLGFCRSGNDLSVVPLSPLSVEVGRETRPIDWRCGSIAVQLRKQLNIPIDVLKRSAWLEEKFDHLNFSCVLTVKPDGTLVDTKVLHTSDSEAMDRKGVDLIKAAAPFHRAWEKITEDQSFVVEFPLLKVRFLK